MAEETPARVPGWTKIKEGRSSRYRGPDGVVVGDFKYRQVYNEYKRTGNAPQSATYSSSNAGGNSSLYNASSSAIELDISDNAQSTPTQAIPLPTPKSTPATKTHKGSYTAKEITGGIEVALVLLTSLVAMAMTLPEAQMTESEVKAIAIPFGNIIERSKYNILVGNLVVGKSDWALMGYAMWQYISRVNSAVAIRKEQTNGQPTGHTTQAPQPGQPVPGGNGTYSQGYTGSVPLHYAPAGLRGFTGTV